MTISNPTVSGFLFFFAILTMKKKRS